jgi:hypothetical protein
MPIGEACVPTENKRSLSERATRHPGTSLS